MARTARSLLGEKHGTWPSAPGLTMPVRCGIGGPERTTHSRLHPVSASSQSPSRKEAQGTSDCLGSHWLWPVKEEQERRVRLGITHGSGWSLSDVSFFVPSVNV